MTSIRHLKTCTSITAVLVALAVTSAASAADRSKLPTFAGGALSFDSMASADRVPSFTFARAGHRLATSGLGTDASRTRTEEYKASWFLDKINAAAAYAMGYTGKGVLTAVVDSGIDVTHPEFTGRISSLSRSLFYKTDPKDLSDVDESGKINGHGTMVSGIIGAARDGKGMMGVAPDAEIMAVRVDWGMTEDLDWTGNKAIIYAAGKGAKVLNGSFGPVPYVMPHIYDKSGKRVPNPNYAVLPNLYVDGFSLANDYKAAKAAADADVVMVFAAANDYREQPLGAALPSGHAILPLLRPENHGKGYYSIVVGWTDPDDPKSLVLADPNDPDMKELDFSDLQGALIAVVSTDRNNRIASYSNRCGAAWLWCLAAPGGDFPGPGQEKKDTQYPTPHPYGDYGWGNGTSAAAPVVSGGAAVVRGVFPYFTARQTIEVILTTATDIGPREIYGRGMFNLGRAVKGPYEFGAEGFAQTFDVNTKGYDSVWSNDIRGTGGLIKRGEGNLVLTGDNTYAGGTDVRGGILTLNGSLKSALAIRADATLRGIGHVDGPLSVKGILDPGNVSPKSTGTLTVSGDAALHAGSTFNTDVSGSGHDRLRVNGTAFVSGSTLDINLVNGAAPVNKSLDVLLASGGVEGTFKSFRTNSISAFLDPTLFYVADLVTVQFERNGRSLVSAAGTANQASVAAAAQGLGAGNAVHDALAQNSLSSAAGAFDAMSGDVHASVASSAYGDAALVSRTVLGRLAQSNEALLLQGQSVVLPGFDPRTFALWGEGFGSWGRMGSDGNAGSISTSTGGFVLGAEATFENGYKAGFAGGFTSTDVDGRSSTAVNESVFAPVYGSARWGAINARIGASFSAHDIDVNRGVTFTGLRNRTSASYGGTTVQAFGELGYSFALGKVELQPFLGASVLRLRTESFAEDGGIAALTGYGRTYDLATTTLGMRAEARLGTDLPLTVRGMLGWRHAYGDVNPKALMGFSGGAATFGVSGVPVDRDALVAEAGIDWHVSKDVTLGVAYQGQVGCKAQDHALKSSFTVRF